MKILIIQLRRIGDVVLTTPVIDALRKARPEARIDFLVEEAAYPVVEGYPGLDGALLFDKRDFWKWARDIRRRRYDWVLDFMNNPRTAQLTALSGARVRAGFDVPGWGLVYNVRLRRDAVPTYAVQSKFDLLRALGVPVPLSGVLPSLSVNDEKFEGAEQWWRAQGLDRFTQRVAVMPAHRRPIRQWPAGRFAETMDILLKAPGRAVILLGGPGEEGFLESFRKGREERVFVMPPGTLRQALMLLRRCQAALTNDSGLMHLAVAVGTPTVTVYGSSWPECWNPMVPPHRYLQARGLACLACNLDHCPYGHECMEWVPAERAAAEVERALHV